jgi:hypothetical protein
MNSIIISITLLQAGAQINVSGTQAGHTYQIERAPALNAPWITVNTFEWLLQRPFIYRDPFILTNAFYRVEDITTNTP